MRSVGLVLGVALIVSLAHAQAPVVNAGGVVNNADYAVQGVAPGSIIAIFGTNLASNLAIGDTVPLSNSLDTLTSVTFNGLPAGVYFVSPNQIDAQLPWESVPGGTMSVVVTTHAGTSATQTVNVLAAQPGIFTVNQTGAGQAIATDNFDSAISAPTGSITGVNTHPFSIGTQGQNGHALILWCTGLGAVTPAIADGANSYNADGSLTLRNTVAQPPSDLVVMVGGVQAQVLFSGLAPAFVSENQVDVLLGPGTPTGSAVPVQITVNGVTTNQVTIAVGP
jgi:uncharacterized protein (TIGR03437 family)